MKFLIWFGCALVLSLITVSLKYAGVLLGFIPTFILGSLMFWVASVLCKKWDKHKTEKAIYNYNKIVNKEYFYVLFSAVSVPLLFFVAFIADDIYNFNDGPLPIIASLLLVASIVIFVFITAKQKHISNMPFVILLTMSLIAVISSSILQDPDRCLREAYDPTIAYIWLICAYVIFLVILSTRKLSRSSIAKYIMTSVVLIISCCAAFGGCVFSTGYYDFALEKYFYYENGNLVDALDMFWFISSLVMFALMLLPLVGKIILKASQKILDNYYSSLRYREKCYKKVAVMQSYLEKGIITQEEFEKNKNDILKRIRIGVSNNSPKMEITNTKKIDEEKTIPNEESTKSIDTKESAPSVRDDVSREKVETVKVDKLSDEEWEYFYKTDFEKFWEMVLEEYDLSKLPDRIVNLRDDTMIYGEEARKVYLSRLKGVVEYNEWTTMNRPEVIDIRWNTLKYLKKELQEKTSDKVYMLDVIRNYEDKYIRY